MTRFAGSSCCGHARIGDVSEHADNSIYDMYGHLEMNKLGRKPWDLDGFGAILQTNLPTTQVGKLFFWGLQGVRFDARLVHFFQTIANLKYRTYTGNVGNHFLLFSFSDIPFFGVSC